LTAPLSDDEHRGLVDSSPGSPSDRVRELAVQQIKRKRAFQRLAVAFAAASPEPVKSFETLGRRI